MLPLLSRKPLVDKDTQLAIAASIKSAESRTSGEIRVFMEAHCNYVDAMDRAVELFEQLGMQHTTGRNAILIYLAIADHQFALFGDKVIYETAGGPLFWQDAAHKLASHLKKGEIKEGVIACIGMLGDALAAHFPFDPSIKKNELPDEIVFGK